MNDEIYSDGIGEITVTGPTVRIDLVSLSPAERDVQGNPRAVFRQRVIMPLEGFMNARDLMERVAQELIESGAVTRREAAPAGHAADITARRPSPNFS